MRGRIYSWQKFVRTCGNIPKEERGAQKLKKLTLKFHPSNVSYRKYHIMDIECCQKFVRTCGNIPKEERVAQKFKNITLKFHPSKVSYRKYHIMDIECWQKFVRTCGNIPKEERGKCCLPTQSF
jgi:hypothetical protein